MGNYKTWKRRIEAPESMESIAKVNNGNNQDGDISVLSQLCKQ